MKKAAVSYVGPQIISLGHLSPPAGRFRVDPRTWGNNLNGNGSNDHLTIIGLDPGGVTGWSRITLPRRLFGDDVFDRSLTEILKNKTNWFHGQVDCRQDEDMGVYQLRRLIDEFPSAAIIVEDFILRAGRREKSRDLLFPVRVTAKIEHHLWLKGRKMVLQQPSLAKRLTDERLAHLNVYTSDGGMQHARDADRHVLMFIRRCMDTKGKELQYLSGLIGPRV